MFSLLTGLALISTSPLGTTALADELPALQVSVTTTSSIEERDIAEKDLQTEKDRVLSEVSKLNLKDQGDTYATALNQSWSKAELDKVYKTAQTASASNDQKDKEAEETRLKQEQERKAAEAAKAQRAATVRAQQQAVPVSGGSDSGAVTGAATATGGKVFGPNQAREAFEQITADLGVSASEKAIWADVITRESGWNVYATNPSSGAYGLPQSLPGGKMAAAGGDYLTNPYTQLTWMYNYVKERYGSFAGIDWYSRGWY